MNSTELYIAAAEAIKGWGMAHVEGCMLDFEDGFVFCRPVHRHLNITRDPLYVSRFEVQNGMLRQRWNEIGTELFNLQNKELACQAHQKP